MNPITRAFTTRNRFAYRAKGMYTDSRPNKELIDVAAGMNTIRQTAARNYRLPGSWQRPRPAESIVHSPAPCTVTSTLLLRSSVPQATIPPRRRAPCRLASYTFRAVSLPVFGEVHSNKIPEQGHFKWFFPGEREALDLF